MPCTGRYAEAWEYASFWCVGNILMGVHGGAGPADAALEDAQANFVNLGVEANVGMVLYNTTAGASGPVTAVTGTTIAATAVTWDAADAYRIVPLTGVERSTIENYLNITAGNIHAALAASGACDCTLADWAANFLAKLNIIEAGTFHVCACANPGQRMGDDERRLWLEWSTSQLEALRSGKLEVCAGETGSEWPSFDWAEQSTTEFAAGKILINQQLRLLGS